MHKLRGFVLTETLFLCNTPAPERLAVGTRPGQPFYFPSGPWSKKKNPAHGLAVFEAHDSWTCGDMMSVHYLDIPAFWL